MNRRHFLASLPAAFARADVREPAVEIRQVDIVHHTHTDVGYTELPSVIRDLQKRYLDAAIDCCRADPTFRWTVESLIGLDDWWRATTPTRRAELTDLVRSGRMDVMAMPFNQTALLNARQWRQMMSWIPATQWTDLRIRAAMQNDVNGLPRAGAAALLDRGITHLMMGINADSGGPPFYRPSAFWWKMPDGRRMFVWLGEHYGSAMNYLKPAMDGAVMHADEEHVRAAHAEFAKRIANLATEGYAFDRLILTFTHPQHYDNGGPFPTLSPFVATWNRLGLEPVLRLTTATEAVFAMEKAYGARVPELTGEWTDWWANGSASGPREVAASRASKRYIAAAESPVFGPMPAAGQAEVERALRDLCIFDEHTWGSHASISQPYSFDTVAQYTEKAELAYRPFGASEMLLRRRVRSIMDGRPAGTYAINPTAAATSGWAGEGKNRFWVERLAARSVAARSDVQGSEDKPRLATDPNGWPITAGWPGMEHDLFAGSLGDFICTGVTRFADRRTIANLHAEFDAEKRAASFRESRAQYKPASSHDTPHTIVFEQQFAHERLSSGSRTVELWRREQRARVTVRFDRISSLVPEVLHLEFALPPVVGLPELSCGGMPFTPYRDQLKGTCKDYFAIDGWARYATKGGQWLWVSRDAPLVSIARPHVVELHQNEPENDRRRILAMVFDNCWHTNFVADAHGSFEFQFDLVWRPRIEAPAELAEAISTDPIAYANPALHETEPELNRIYRP